MEYKALYRKYRPEKFSDVVGQDYVVEILKNSIASNKIGHAYLFSGTRGTGKTSVAKIMAKTVNCLYNESGEKCGKCAICKQLKENDIDIIEIDAASNNGVDEIREIRNNAKLLPNIGKYKVYIIDEVHMLSTGAFNALLKTLEEPPEHVIFILATTELQKIPLTILSRCQKFEFKKITEENIFKRLKYIAGKESIDIDKEALDLIVELSDGGLRDAINMLDQASADTKETITPSKIYELSGIVSNKEINDFIENILNCDSINSLAFIDNLYKSGKSYRLTCETIVENLRKMMINNLDSNKDNKKIIILIKTFINLINNLRTSLSQKILFEVTVLELIQKLSDDNSGIIVKQIEVSQEKSLPKVSEKLEKKVEEKEEKNNELDEILNIRINNTLAEAKKEILNSIKSKSDDISLYISNINYNKAANILSDCNFIIASPTHIVCEVKNAPAKAIFKDNIDILEDLIEIIFNNKYLLSCLTKDEWKETKKEYVENKKKNIKYELIEEKPIKKAVAKKKVTKAKKDAIDLFGEEYIK